VSAELPATVPEVIGRLEAIEASAPKSDGVVCFARLYREVTQGVDVELVHATFADSRFLERLDVCFAGLFFSALASYEQDPSSASSAWAPLFAQRSRRGIAPLQFALAGMNAHINRDLPDATHGMVNMRTNVDLRADDDLRGSGWRRRAQIGDEVADREVGLVADAGDRRDRARRDGARNRFLIERPEVFE